MNDNKEPKHVITFQVQNPHNQNVGTIDDAFEEFFKAYNEWFNLYMNATYKSEKREKETIPPEPGTAEHPFEAENGCIITWAPSK